MADGPNMRLPSPGCETRQLTLRGRNLPQPHLGSNLLPQHILRNFPRDGHRKPVQESHVPRDLEPRNLTHAELTNFARSCLRAGAQDDAGTNLLAVFPVRNPNHLHVLYFWMAVEKFLDLAWIDVLATADHHVLRTPDDVAITIRVQRGKVTGVHPAFGVDRFDSPRWIIPVTQHDRITPCQQLAGCAARNRVSGLVHDLDLQVRLDEADRRHPPLGRI